MYMLATCFFCCPLMLSIDYSLRVRFKNLRESLDLGGIPSVVTFPDALRLSTALFDGVVVRSRSPWCAFSCALNLVTSCFDLLGVAGSNRDLGGSTADRQVEQDVQFEAVLQPGRGFREGEACLPVCLLCLTLIIHLYNANQCLCLALFAHKHAMNRTLVVDRHQTVHPCYVKWLRWTTTPSQRCHELDSHLGRENARGSKWIRETGGELRGLRRRSRWPTRVATLGLSGRVSEPHRSAFVKWIRQSTTLNRR